MQFGYFVGSIAGGLALAVGGYNALGATMGILFLGAAALVAQRPLLLPTRLARTRPAVAQARA
jgi:predicted MFS family arabinose efflux permease